MIVKGRILFKYILECRDMVEYFSSNVFLRGKVCKILNRIFMVCSFGMLFLFSSCIPESDFTDDPEGNFEALWSIMDERYCFFDYKNIDWNEVHQRYRSRIAQNMTDEELFGVLADMLAELQDGHVNLSSSFDMARYWKWFEDYPVNFNEEIVNKYYLQQPDYQIAGGMKYRILANTNIGYIYYASFSSGVGESNLDQIFAAFSSCDGIIIDVRDNSGGILTTVNRIASRFITEDRICGYIRHKTGPAHDALSDFHEIRLETAPSDRIHYLKPVAVLTNRRCYSATNNFVSVMKELPQVKIIGDYTGGGSGLPVSSELPNGWSVRFSASPIYNVNKEHTEFGIAPDIFVNMADTPDRDAIIERAKEWIMSGGK